MERNFLGLASSNVQHDPTGASKDSVPMRGSAMQWSFSNKISAIPQFLSFKAGLEEKPRKSGQDPLTSSGLAPSSGTDDLDSNQKPYSSVVQNNMNLDKQGSNHYTMTTYSGQHFDAYQLIRPRQVRIIPVSNQQNRTIMVSTNTSVLQSHVCSMGQTLAGNSMNSQTLGGVPIISPVTAHPNPNSIVGITDLRDDPKSSGSPAQLTIFYAGSVCVYDDISPEKAQAIMLLAGNGSSITHNKTVSTAPVQSPVPRPSTGNDYVGNKTHISSPCSGLPSPISLASSSTNELATVKSVGTLVSASNQTDPSKAVSSVGPGSANLIPSVAVPQARKASLVRFLEKRKERVLNSSPYNVSKKCPDYAITESDGMSLSVDFFSSPAHHLAVKGGTLRGFTT